MRIQRNILELIGWYDMVENHLLSFPLKKNVFFILSV